MSRLMFVSRLKFIGGLLVVVVFLSSFAAYGQKKGLYLSDPNVNGTGKTYRYLEVGAKASVDIKYERTLSDYSAISGAMLYMTYDKSKINKSSIQLIPKFENYLTVSQWEVTDTEIKIQLGLNTARSPIEPFPIGDDTVIATLSFHVLQNNLNDGKTLDVMWNTNPNLVQVSVVKSGGSTAVDSTATNTINGVILEQGVPPKFGGLDRDATDPKVGNTLDITWTENAGSSNDQKNGKAETLYPDKKLRYRIYRSEGGDAFNPNSKVQLQSSYAPTTYRDGPGTGVPAGTNPLKDGTKYWYKVTAIDDTYNDSLSSNPNEQPFTEVAQGWGIPTDTTPPGNGSLSVSPGDRKLTISWSKPSDADYDGVVIIRNVGKPVGDGTLGGANGTTYEHGPVYKVGDKPFGEGNGEVIYVGPMPPTEDTNLQNGTLYYYKAFAYDKAEGDIKQGNLVQMGRNYSSGVSASGAPGVAPDAITNFYAISRMAENEITLKWDNPTDSKKPQGGTVIWYTTDLSKKWGNIPDDPNGWPNAVTGGKMKLLKIEPRTDQTERSEEVVVSRDEAGTTLSTAETYFFKAFAYNETGTPLTAKDLMDVNKIKTYQFSAGAIAAAVPASGGGGAASGTITYNFTENGLGINTFTIPFTKITSPKIETAKDFVELVNNAAKGNVVTVFGYWDNDKKTFNGGKVVYKNGSFTEETSNLLEKIKLVPNQNYQITISGIGENEVIRVTIQGEWK